MKISLNGINFILTIFIFISNFCVFPILKYLEYAHNGLRLNITVVNIVFIIIYGFFLSLNAINLKNLNIKFTTLVSAIIFLISISILFNLPSIIHSQVEYITILKVISQTIISYVLLLLLGINLSKYSSYQQRKVFRILFWFWLITSCFYLFFIITNPKGFYIILNGEKVIYLMLSDSYALLSLLIFSFLMKSHGLKKLLFSLVTLVILYGLLSRASFYLTTIIFLIYFLYNHTKTTFLITSIIVVLISINFNFGKISGQGLEINATTRMYRVLIGEKDPSKEGREQIFNEGLSRINRNPFFGEFMGDVKVSGTTGRYIHNFLSYWENFGIIIFSLFIILMVYIVYYNIKFLKRSRNMLINNQRLLLGMFLIAQVILFRSFVYSDIFLLFGLFILKAPEKDGFPHLRDTDS